MGREKIFFFFVFHIEWLNFTLHWHIWGDAPWNQSNSGISEEQYFETSGDMWPYYFLHLRTDYTIMWQLQRWNCADGMFPTSVNWFLTALRTETIEQITNDSTKGIDSSCNLDLFFSCWKLRAHKRSEKKRLRLGFALSDCLKNFSLQQGSLYSWSTCMTYFFPVLYKVVNHLMEGVIVMCYHFVAGLFRNTLPAVMESHTAAWQ